MIGGSGPIGTYHVGVPAFRKGWMTVKLNAPAFRNNGTQQNLMFSLPKGWNTVKLNVPAFRKGWNAPKLSTVTAEADAEMMLLVVSKNYPKK